MIVHYHILKNAGTTVEELLWWNFREKFSRFDTEDRDYAISNAELLKFLDANPHLEAITSHQLYDPVPLVPGYIFFDLCFLRDPLERIRSTYDFFRTKPSPGDPISDLAGRSTLGEFVEVLINEYPWMVNDVQTNQLANGLINDQPKGSDDLDRATRRVLNTALLGVVDRFAESVVTMQHAARMQFPYFNRSHEPVNVSRGMSGTLEDRTRVLREACGEKLFAQLMAMNQLDYELLKRARAEVERRFAMVEDRDERLKAFAEQRAPQPASFPKEAETLRPMRLPRMKVLKLLARQLRSEAMFDADYYRRTNPDLPEGINLRVHFLTRGAFEGRNPHPLIDLEYYIRTGNPHPLFDSDYYTRMNPDVRKARMDPLLHYVLHGRSELRKPHPWFDSKYYVLQCPDAMSQPLVHFLEHGFLEHCAGNPHPLFDCATYVRAHPEATGNPLVHFVLTSKQPAVKDCLELEISDVKLPVRLSKVGSDREVAAIWQNDAGWTEFSAPAQLRPFFLPLRYPQIRAQLK